LRIPPAMRKGLELGDFGKIDVLFSVFHTPLGLINFA
jgi:hypothetical protein